MRTHADIIEWYKGTGLRPYLNALQEPERSEFEQEITSEVQKAYTPRPDGSIIFRFPRLFSLLPSNSCYTVISADNDPLLNKKHIGELTKMYQREE